MNGWINTTAIFQILVAGLIVGAGLPALFSIGVRLNAEGVGVAEHGGVTRKSPVLVALSWAIFLLVLTVVLLGILFIARDFIGHHTGWYLLGAKAK
ncbi:hypothetical protein [Mycolicibacterium brumae]|uniref:Transmembrane protein n=1 Tax=Mycolicibacterium brumae TaxID=85968 RepID=A0A2G5PHN7_9MYCO|nr:hypothetical protein [Mycolicibacterium brumae]MCV7192447.1 hypothetical protein [Mycolicibacterium brumae]PIB77543.1 hypothetical protein CQY22_000855 [Mycolicibacterium brumae]RWA18560.1 hypothetical protein MBRU_04895 [Mycolicibacterium brumae DSM 44177]UWW10215.1 hypothetical protein L2Z93_003342 [Mycolicibacterium brumae]